jgi:hypothetical protein
MNESELENKDIEETEFQQLEEETSKISEKELEELRNNVESFTEEGVEYVQVPLDAKQLKEKYIALKKMEIDNAYNELALSEMFDQAEKQLPRRLLQDSINDFTKDLAEGKISKNKNGVEIREDATEAERDMMQIKLNHLKKELELDLPMKNLRNQISQFKLNMDRDDAPGKNIKKLRKEIRLKKETVLSTRYQAPNKSKTYVG